MGKKKAAPIVVEEAPDVDLPVEEVVEEVEVIPAPTSDEVVSVLEASSVGTVLEKQSHGWKVTLQEGGTVVRSEGATLSFALFER